MYALGEFEGAWKQIQRAHHRDRDDLFVLVHLLAPEGQLGKSRAAKETLIRINKLRDEMGWRDISVRNAQYHLPYKNPTHMARLIDGLKKARVPFR